MQVASNIRLFGIKWLSVLLDLATIAGIFCAMTLLREITDGTMSTTGYFRLWPFLVLFWLVFEKLGLYNGTSINSGSAFGPIEEIRRIIYALAAIFIVLGFSNYCYRPGDYLYSRSVLAGSCFFCMVFVPLNRAIFRRICTRLGYWGVPAAILGSGETAQKIAEDFSNHPEYGITVIGFFSDDETYTMPKGVEFLGSLSEVSDQSKARSIKYGILTMDALHDRTTIQQLIEHYEKTFHHLLIIPPSLLTTSANVIPKDLAGTLGLEIQHNLQIPSIYRIKRALDFLLTIPCLIAALPAIGLICIWVKIDSRGPVLFKHGRIAKNGSTMNIYKFRTMVVDAQEMLDELFEKQPELKQEWDEYGKLDNDPRITRAGRWLRKSSMDELPQLFNILQGKLTLVGPRPIVEHELAQYGEDANLFHRVLGGVTGLWQVSGRNDVTYSERVRLDKYYVNNWSVWLDIYILAKTVGVVLFQRGAR